MLKAMKDINKIKPKKPFLIKQEKQYATKKKKQVRMIANHFKNNSKKTNVDFQIYNQYQRKHDFQK